MGKSQLRRHPPGLWPFLHAACWEEGDHDKRAEGDVQPQGGSAHGRVAVHKGA